MLRVSASGDRGQKVPLVPILYTYQTRSSFNIYRQMALFEMVQTLISRFANMEKWINSLNVSTLIFRTLQYTVVRQPKHIFGVNIVSSGIVFS